ncbi:hypothetical protein [Streptomyces sp. H39-S7]|uniref:hypothetical protein n=1 Tax=Streptomyces sp. H39-S7 TaxID=3004357 RepID=UPI0022AF912F|nr:hypothetical protein [Streptomyces sp. H39-S7]MCZ4120795.1 hypothetical protein [Streptomyces sp. H39-S7]
MGIREDFRQIQQLSHEQLASWLDARFPASAPVQWWGAIFEEIEPGGNQFRDIPTGRRRDIFGLGGQLIGVASERGEVSPALAAYWFLRLSALALKSSPKIAGLPELITPEGAAKWALSIMPISREEVVEYAEERAAAHQRADDGFYAPVGVGAPLWEEPDPHISKLQDVERILSALEWVENSLVDEELHAEVEAWLSIRPRL